MKFEDYYEILGVSKNATEDELQSAYRKLTRKYHPDVSKEPDAEKKFGKINEAYEVLKDPEKRQQYDRLGANYKNGQDFRPPPGFDGGDFSDFINAMFGGVGGHASGNAAGGFEFNFGGGQRSSARSQGFRSAGSRHAQQVRSAPPTGEREVTLDVTLEEVYHCGSRQINIRLSENGTSRTLKLDVKIPAGAKDGTKIRIKGEGDVIGRNGQRGDLFIKLNILKHERFVFQESNLLAEADIPLTTAVLGGKVAFKTLEEELTLSIPAGAQHGQKLRVRGKGLPLKGTKGESSELDRGDILVAIKLRVPKTLNEQERQHWEQLALLNNES